MSTIFSNSYEQKVLTALLGEVATPLAASAQRLIDAGDYVGLVRTKVRPTDYSQPEHYLRDKQCIALLQKHPALPVPANMAKNNAIKSFFDAEKSCYWANEKLNPLLLDVSHYGEGVRQLIVAWRKEVRHVLRKAPPLEAIEGRFGPGSTYANTKELITIADKLDENYTATRTCLKSFSSVWDGTAWSRYAAAGLDHDGTDLVFSHGELRYTAPKDWSPRDFTVIGHNRFTTVPKTAITDRGICIEPSLNVYYQLGVGREIEKRLGRSYGWYKSNIQQYHRWLAKVGSITNSNATIDLSSASDTICTNLVRLVLPPDWYNLLMCLRSSYTLVACEGQQPRRIRLEKFSSMGNGFTFELETLLFYSLARAIERLSGYVRKEVPGDTVSVFGDDIIVPRALARITVDALSFFGFEVNRDKTFLDGPFRESCGGDYFRGANVRPFHIKKDLDSPEAIISAVNGLKRFLDADDSCCRHPLRGTFRTWLERKLPRQIRRCRGPAVLGDVVIHDDEPGRWDTVTRNSIRYLRVWRPVAHAPLDIESHFRPGVVGAYALYRAGSGTSTTVALTPEQIRSATMAVRIRGSYVQGYKFGRLAYS